MPSDKPSVIMRREVKFTTEGQDQFCVVTFEVDDLGNQAQVHTRTISPPHEVVVLVPFHGESEHQMRSQARYILSQRIREILLRLESDDPLSHYEDYPTQS